MSAWRSTATRTAPFSCSKSGRIIDGDAVLLIAARELQGRRPAAAQSGCCDGDVEPGLEKALERDGIRMLRTAVGDKYVLEEMLRTDAALGGEQSGHVILQ